MFFFNICRIDVVRAVSDMLRHYPKAVNRFSISKDENGDGFYLNCPEDCPAEWIFQIGHCYAEIVQRNNPFKGEAKMEASLDGAKATGE